MRHLAAVAKVWRLQWFAAAAVGVALALRCVPRPVSVPGRTSGVEWVLVPVAPAFLCGILPALLRRVAMPFERTSGRLAAGGRMTLVASGWLVAALSVAVGLGEVRVADARNCALTVGVSLLSLRAVPPALAWAPVVLVGLTNWLIGAPAPGERPAPWAVLLQPGGSMSASCVAWATLALGAGSFVLAPPPSGAVEGDG